MTTDALSVFPTVVLCVFVFVRKNGLRRFRWALQRLPPCAADCDSYSPARFRPSACRPHSASGRLDELSDFAVGLRCTAAADGGHRCARSRRGRAVGCRLRCGPCGSPSCVMKGMRVLPVKSCAARKVATGGATVDHQQGRTDVDHVVSPGVGQVGFQRRTVVRGDLAPGLIDDGAVLRG